MPATKKSVKKTTKTKKTTTKAKAKPVAKQAAKATKATKASKAAPKKPNAKNGGGKTSPIGPRPVYADAPSCMLFSQSAARVATTIDGDRPGPGKPPKQISISVIRVGTSVCRQELPQCCAKGDVWFDHFENGQPIYGKILTDVPGRWVVNRQLVNDFPSVSVATALQGMFVPNQPGPVSFSFQFACMKYGNPLIATVRPALKFAG